MSAPADGFDLYAGNPASPYSIPLRIKPKESYTLEHWLYVNSANGSGLLTAIDPGGSWQGYGFHHYLRVTSPGQMYGFHQGYSIYRAGNIPFGVWHHVAWCHFQPYSRAMIFINGEPISVDGQAGTITYFNVNEIYGSYWSPVDAKIARLRQWGRALTIKEIRESMESATPPTHIEGFLSEAFSGPAYDAQALYDPSGAQIHIADRTPSVLGGEAVVLPSLVGVDRVVVIPHEVAGVAHYAVPDADGKWKVTVPPGDYNIQYEAEGFAPVTHGPYTALTVNSTSVTLMDGGSEPLTVTGKGFEAADKLKIGGVEQTAVVQDDTTIVCADPVLPWHPLGPSNILWLDGADSGTMTFYSTQQRVQAWRDVLGRHEFTTTSSSYYPYWFDKAVFFTGSNNFLQSTSLGEAIATQDEFIVAMVCGVGRQVNGGLDSNWSLHTSSGVNVVVAKVHSVYDGGSATGYDFRDPATEVPRGEAVILLYVFTSTGTQVYENGVLIGDLAAMSGWSNAEKLTLGAEWDNASISDFWSGEMHDVIVDSDTANRQKLEGFLAYRHRMADKLPDAHPYKSEAPGR